MGIRCTILALMMASGVFGYCSGQASGDRERNIKYLDSIRDAVETYYCQGNFAYPEIYDKKEVNKVISAMKVLNFIAKSDVTVRQADSALSRIEFKKLNRDSYLNGLLRIITVQGVLKYLSMTIKYVCIDGVIITKKFVLRPTTTVYCPSYGNGLPDLKILTEVYAKYIDYPIRLVDLSYVLVKTFDPDALVSVEGQHKEYHLFTDRLSSAQNGDPMYGLFLKQYDPDSSCCYSYEIGALDMIRLIREGRYDVIRDLVFSPNYFYAINAMEAALYLSHAGKLLLDDTVKERISELKVRDFKIEVRHSDVRGWRDGYMSMNTSDEAVIRKYQRSLR